jgi:isopentenyldiphosphate isomerase
MGREEVVDVVDAEDRVVAQATREEVRRRRLLHRATYVLVFNAGGQLFVHRRTATKDVYPFHFDVAVGGVVTTGESYDEAAQRELAEEIGVRDVALRCMLPFHYEDEGNRVNGMVYSCTYDGPVRLCPEEIISGEWLDLDQVFEQAQHEPFCPDGLEALIRYLDRLANAQSGSASAD